MYWEQKVEYAALTDIGFRRTNNQDSCAALVAPDRDSFEAKGHIFVVADGMGGHAVGELASRMATDLIPHTFVKSMAPTVPQALHDALSEANSQIFHRALQNQDFFSMGTTGTTLVLSPLGAFAGHVGDSRLYRVRGGLIEQLTFDHSVQWELTRNSKVPIDPAVMMEYKNVITRSLGPHASVQIDIEGPYTIHPEDIYILCSDGLSGLVSDEEIGMITSELPAPEACQMLVDLANLRGGADNITVVVVRVGDLPKGLAPLPESTTVSIDEPIQPGWGWFIALCGHTALFCLSITMIALGRVVEGLLVLGLVLIISGALFVAWMRLFYDRHPQQAFKIRTGRPYRTSSSSFNPKFLTQMASLESILKQTADEAGWGINWDSYNEAMTLANQAWEMRSAGGTMHHISVALRRLLSQLQAKRRR
ncbi:MAG: serine/threonine-protein phosphatase [Planctomycetaceae bacterium]|nr:serine/threonine-protein phosphatase [Planctomycetaceae bacterium]